MPRKTAWTSEQDEIIKQGWQDGTLWRDITKTLGGRIKSKTIIARGRYLGAAWTLLIQPALKPKKIEVADTGRGPLPPGHPVTWNCLTKGTMLENTPYPDQLFHTETYHDG